jgi:hypothetical protein
VNSQRSLLARALAAVLLTLLVVSGGASSATADSTPWWVDQLVDDMTLRHEALMEGVPAGYSWGAGPRVGMGNDTRGFTAATAWGQVYAASNGAGSTNTRVALRNIGLAVLSKRTGRWTVVQDDVTPAGGYFAADFQGNRTAPGSVRRESDGSISVMPGSGFNFHFWAINRVNIDPSDIGGVAAWFQARLVVDNPGRPDDRASARFLPSAGIDWWASGNASWNNLTTNGDASIGRARFVRNDWALFTTHTLSPQQITQNPPPIPARITGQTPAAPTAPATPAPATTGNAQSPNAGSGAGTAAAPTAVAGRTFGNADGITVADARGGVRVGGADTHVGDLPGLAVNPNQPITGLARTASNGGYWLVARDGGLFAFGDARFHGSMGGQRLNQPVVGMAPTPSGNGYWMVARDGGIFAFGDARFHGSMGGQRLNQPVVGMTATPSGNGYWLVAADGGIFAFGDATFHGSTAELRRRDIAHIAALPAGGGYRIVSTAGNVWCFGAARCSGDTAGKATIGIQTSMSGDGYRLVGADGSVAAFGDAPAVTLSGTGSTPVAITPYEG